MKYIPEANINDSNIWNVIVTIATPESLKLNTSYVIFCLKHNYISFSDETGYILTLKGLWFAYKQKIQIDQLAKQ